MPLSDGYGVVVGSVVRHFIEPPDNEGRWPHYFIYVDTPQRKYECVVNLKSRTETKIEYRDFRNVARAHFDSILSLPDGFHALESRSDSGALDVIRHPGLQDPRRGLFWWPWWSWLGRTRCPCTRWWLESGVDLVQLMEYYLTSMSRIYVFGEPYTNGLGIHNIHMTQGDPIDSPFSAENGIWQDGGLIIEYTAPQQRLSVFLTKFETQSLNTDENGRPIG